MRKLSLSVAVLLLCGNAYGQNLLTDPGMNSVGPNGQLANTPNAPWQITASRGANMNFDDALASEAFADVDGGGFGLFFKAFIGNPPWDPTAGTLDASIYQDVPGTPGSHYTLRGYWGAESNYSGLNTPGANSIFAIDFYGNNVLIGSVQLDLEAAGLGGPAIGLNYEEFTVSGIAPAGTDTVRARGSMIDAEFFLDPGQALVTDSWSLTVPEPGTTLLAGAAALGLLARKRR